MAVTTISLSSVKNYTDDLTKDKFDSLNFVSFDGGELATVSGNSIYNIILGDNDTAGSLTYRISAAENDILELNNKLGDGFSDTSTVTQQFSTAKERITAAEETAQVAASTLDNFLTVADGKDFLFFLDDLTVPVGRMDKVTNGEDYFKAKKFPFKKWSISMPNLVEAEEMFAETDLEEFTGHLPSLRSGTWMFNGTKIKEWNIELPCLSSAYGMFRGTLLEMWDIPLSELAWGGLMFADCANLSEFNIELPKLEGADSMFRGTALKEWHISLAKITNSFTGWARIRYFSKLFIIRNI